jgi:hypothetical protein
MFSPQFMNFIIDPKGVPGKGFGTIPIAEDKNIKSDVAGITRGMSRISALNKDVFDKYKNNVCRYDSASNKSSAFASVSALTNAIIGRKRVPAE